MQMTNRCAKVRMVGVPPNMSPMMMGRLMMPMRYLGRIEAVASSTYVEGKVLCLNVINSR
jgi:hypothetical protein